MYNFKSSKKYLVITNNNTKLDILSYLSDKDEIYDVKFINEREFIDKSLFTFNDLALYNFRKKFNIELSFFKEITPYLYFLENSSFTNKKIDFLKEVKDYFVKESLITYNEPFIKLVKSRELVILDIEINDLLIQALNTLDIKYSLASEDKVILNDEIKCTRYNTSYDEVNYTFEKIAKLIVEDKVSPDNIFIHYTNDIYLPYLVTFSSKYNIPIQLDEKESLSLNSFCKKILNDLPNIILSAEDYVVVLKKELDNLPFNVSKNIYNPLLNIFLKYINLSDSISEIEDIIRYEINNTYIKKDIYTNIVNVKDMSYTNIKDNNHLFILGLNDEVIIQYKKDNAFLVDEVKKNFNMDTTLDKRLKDENHIIKLINTTKNLYISTFKTHNKVHYNESNILSRLSRPIVFDEFTSHVNTYSKIQSTINISRSLGTTYENESIKYLESYYDSELNTLGSYNPEFINLNEKDDNSLRMSFSSISKYDECPFDYYLEKKLKLKDQKKDTFNLDKGSIAHYILEKIAKRSFNVTKGEIELLANEYINDNGLVFDPLSYIYIDKVVDNIYEYLYFYKELNKSDYDIVEQEYELMLVLDEATKLVGTIDRLDANDEFINIIDYKSSEKNVKSDLINTLQEQLLYYALLIKKGINTNTNDNPYSRLKILGLYYQNISPVLLKSDVKEKNYLVPDNFRLRGVTFAEPDDVLSYASSLGIDLFANLTITSKGNYHKKHSKVLTYEELDSVLDNLEKNIKSIVEQIRDSKFNFIADSEHCKYCSYENICYKNNL